MAKSYKLEMVTIGAIAFLFMVFLYSGSLSGNTFAGTDSIAAKKISGSNNLSNEDIHPLIPQWVPPGVEIESTLFGIQAAVGGMFIGGVFGYWIGQRKNGKSPQRMDEK